MMTHNHIGAAINGIPAHLFLIFHNLHLTRSSIGINLKWRKAPVP
jgi:hypothetical protein